MLLRNLARTVVQFDRVGAVDLSQVRPGAAFVNAEQRLERFERAAVDTEGIRQQLADRRLPARFINGLGVAGAEKKVIGLPAGLGVAAEERADSALEVNWQRRHRRPATKTPQGQADEQLSDRNPRAEMKNSSPETVVLAAFHGLERTDSTKVFDGID